MALERQGTPPKAVVLLDTYLPSTRDSHLLPALMTDMARRLEGPNDEWLTAMAVYLRLFRDWTPSAITTPTLLVRATDPVPGWTGDGWRTGWPSAHTVIDAPGDHFTMMENHAAETARLVHGWL